MERQLATHNSVAFILKEFDGIGLCLLAVDSKMPGHHKAPGGKNTFHPEESPRDTVIRKVREETGAEIKNAGRNFFTDTKKDPNKFFFLADEVSNLPDLKENRKLNGLDSYWVPISSFFENKEAGKKILFSEKMAFEILVSSILSKDKKFIERYHNVFMEANGIKKEVKFPKFFDIINAVKKFFRAR